MTAVLGIVAALEMERRWIGAPEPLVELSGVGDARAENAAHRLVDRGATALVSWGVAGGLDPDLEPGTVVLPDAVVHADGSSSPVDEAWRDRLLERVSGRVVISTLSLYHASSVITSPDEKRAVYERVGAGAVDMESAAVAAVATETGIPFVVVRVVVWCWVVIAVRCHCDVTRGVTVTVRNDAISVLCPLSSVLCRLSVFRGAVRG